MRLKYVFAVALLAGGSAVYAAMAWIMLSAVLRSIAEALSLLGVAG